MQTIGNIIPNVPGPSLESSIPEHTLPAHRFSDGGPFDQQIDASDMGLKPGEWPDTVGIDYETEVAVATKAEPMETWMRSTGETIFEGYKYVTPKGIRIAVWND